MDNQHVEVLSLSSEGTGVNLQVLKGQVNYLQWWRDFQVVAQAKGFFDIITGREAIYAPPNPSDFGFDEVEEVENIEDVNSSEGPKGPIIVDGKIIKPDTKEEEVVEKTKKSRRGRFSLTPHELSSIRDEASSSQAKETTGSTHKKLDFSSRLALYKFNLDAYEKSHKRVHQAMALLVYWVDPVIRGRLQSYVEPFAAVKYLESQYKMSEVRLQESAANNFEHIHLSKCRGVQDFLNKIENARQDILDSGGMCTEGMIISKIMRSLTPQFNPFVDHYHFFRDNDPSTLDLAQMTARILTFESDLEQRKTAKALVTIAPGKPRNELKCDTCNKKGHTKDRCWQTYPHLKKSPQELQAAREKPRTGPTKAETPRKVLAVATTNLELFNQNLLNERCTICDRKGHLKNDCWLAYPGQNKPGRRFDSGIRRPHARRCKTLSSEITDTEIDSEVQNLKISIVSVKDKTGKGDYIGGIGNTGLEYKSGVQGANLCSSLSLRNGKGANSWLRDDFVPHFLNPTGMMLLGTDSTDMEQDKWILDSGANVHAVNNMKWFNNFHEFDMKVATADDVNTIDILGGGTVEVSTLTDEGELVTLELSKVAYSPGLRCNILSLSLLGKVGNLKGCWSTDKIEIVTHNNELVCSATEQEGLYVLNFSKYGKHTAKARQLPTKSQISVPGGVKPPCIVATIDFREKVWKWHRRLGHLGLENLRRLLKVSEGMDITDKEIRNKLGAVCPVCATSRAVYTIPRDPATRRYKNAGELIHVDSWGPYAMVGIGGVKGFVALTDEATRFIWTRSYKKKEEVVSIFLDMLKMIGRTHNIEIRRVRMDNEFQDIPEAQREDVFMSGAIQSDSDSENNQNPPAIFADNSESHSSESSSSSEGEESPFFQRQNPPAVQMTKRKYSSKEQDDKKASKREKTGQPEHEKCANCLKQKAYCDGTHPFLEKCSNCIKRNQKCYPQGVDPKSIPKRNIQQKHEKCGNCLKVGSRCDGIYPFHKKCTPCTKNRGRCYPQGHTPKKVTTEEKCGACRRHRLMCNGEMPCQTCIKDKKTCVYVDNDEIWTWEPNEKKWKNASEGNCHECMTRNQKFFGGAPDTCNGEFPCNCCTEQTFGSTRHRCTYHLENGIKKQYRLSHEKLQRKQVRDSEWKEKDRSKNRKNLRKRLAKDSDSETETDDLDEDLFDQFHSDDDNNQGGDDSNDDDSDQGGNGSDKIGRSDDQNQHQNHDHGNDQSEPDDRDRHSSKQGGNENSSQHSHKPEQQELHIPDSHNSSSLQSPKWGDFENPSNSINNNFSKEDMEDSQYFTDNVDDINDDERTSDDEDKDEKSSLLNTKGQVYSFKQEPAKFRQKRHGFGYTCSSDSENNKRPDQDSDSWTYLSDPKKEEIKDICMDSDKENIDPTITKQLTPSQNCVICLAEMALDPEPRNRKEALQRPDATKWIDAMQDEYNSLMKNKTWEVVDDPKDQHVISSRWVLRRKLGADGNVVKYKARFVGRGFEQIHGVDFDETFASVVKQPSYRILFALQAMLGWKCHQMDVKTAFLHGDVDEVIYIRPPDGFPETNGKVLRLRKALYGLKQSPRLWYLRLKKFLTSKGWKASSFDTSVFIHPSGMILTVYVDDINIFGKSEDNIIKFKKELAEEFEMTDLGECAYYLGLHVHMRPEGTYLHQASFIQQILNRFSLNDIKPVSTPTNLANKLTANKDETAAQDFTRLYQAMVGSVIYLATVSRPDIAFATSRISRYMSNPSDNHMKEVHRLYAYLKGSMNLGLMFDTQSKNNIQGMVDSDWGNCPDTTRSTGGWIFNLGGSPVSWSSKRQATVALSSCEAEYMAASEATKEAIWIRNLVQEFQLPMFKNLTIPIAIDNNSAMKLSKNPEFHARTKHIAMRHHFIREKVAQKEVQVHRVDTKNNLADLLTKGLPRPRFQELIQKMGMQSMQQGSKFRDSKL